MFIRTTVSRGSKPCAEVLLTEDAAERILEEGLIPLVSFKDRDVVRVIEISVDCGSVARACRAVGRIIFASNRLRSRIPAELLSHRISLSAASSHPILSFL